MNRASSKNSDYDQVEMMFHNKLCDNSTRSSQCHCVLKSIFSQFFFHKHMCKKSDILEFQNENFLKFTVLTTEAKKKLASWRALKDMLISRINIACVNCLEVYKQKMLNTIMISSNFVGISLNDVRSRECLTELRNYANNLSRTTSSAQQECVDFYANWIFQPWLFFLQICNKGGGCFL